ncbi:MAG: pyruvate, phosphate dikinase, partial [Deltaproteobacteria bacterium]|nr:pyruvate, phosphate dikinase [Deltaproteobacteria bacterium]
MKKVEVLKKRSKALEVNIADYHVDAQIDPGYSILQEIMSKYYGLMEGLNTFLKELSHPYKNWQFIVKEARNYTLNYFHLLKKHPEGPHAVRLYMKIFLDAIESAEKAAIKADAADNLLLFLQKILKDSGPEINRFKPVLDEFFMHIRNQPDEYFFLFVKSYYRVERLAEDFLNAFKESPQGYESINLLSIKYFKYTYAYWLNEVDPLEWLKKEIDDTGLSEEVKSIFTDISIARIQSLEKRMREIVDSEDVDSREMLKRLLELTGYGQFVETYRKIPQKLFKAGGENDKGRRWKLFFLFHIMNTSGLLIIHEEALRDINRSLSYLIAKEEPSKIRRLLEETFSILKERAEDFPSTALNCVLNMGEGVYKTDDNDFVNFF